MSKHSYKHATSNASSMEVKSLSTKAYYERDIPQTHKVPAFLDVWYKWVDFRRMGDSMPRNQDTMFRQQLSDFAIWGLEASIQALNDAIRCNYKGPVTPQHLRVKATVKPKINLRPAPQQ